MIRAALPTDLPRLLDMGRAFHTEAGYSESVPFCEESFKLTLAKLGHAGTLLVADKGEGAIGMGAVDMAPSICNYAVRFAREVFWYLDPNHRLGLGREMLNALECAARSVGADFFDVVAEEGKRNQPLARIYRAGGFSPAEYVHRKRL